MRLSHLSDIQESNQLVCAPWHRLNSCQAWFRSTAPINSDKGNTYIYTLRSYSTIVAYYISTTHQFIIRDYYSNTTSHHITKWINLMIKQLNLSDYSVVYCWARSDKVMAYFKLQYSERTYRCSAKDFALHKDEDFNTLIKEF